MSHLPGDIQMPNQSPEPTAVGAVCFAQGSRIHQAAVRLRPSFFR
jgi:hypothetical protein